VPERSGFAPGTPSWVDLNSSDVAESVRFYGQLFGWDHAAAPGGAEQMGRYGFFFKDGMQVAGIAPQMNEARAPSWTTYVSVDDADAAVSRVIGAGGTPTAEPLAVGDVVRLAFFVDPTGAFLGVIQPGTHHGAQLINEPGALTWNELNTWDPVAAHAFYSAVFGWDAKAEEVEEGETYTRWLLGEDPIAGLLDIRSRDPDMAPAHWLTYFAVEECDATVRRVNELGGELRFGPVDLPMGRFAALADPQGAGFAVFEQITVGP
jgi:predicted enzyme related to lactoylglutathione lyase